VLHVELDNVLGRESTRTRTNWAGPRNIAPLYAVEDYHVTLPPSLYIRWRQTF